MPHDDDDHHQEEEQQRPRLRRTKTIAGDEDVQELALGAEDTIERPNNAAIAGAMNTAESRRPLGEKQEELLTECLRPVSRLYIASNVCALACVVKIYVSYLLLQHSVS